MLPKEAQHKVKKHNVYDNMSSVLQARVLLKELNLTQTSKLIVCSSCLCLTPACHTPISACLNSWHACTILYPMSWHLSRRCPPFSNGFGSFLRSTYCTDSLNADTCAILFNFNQTLQRSARF